MTDRGFYFFRIFVGTTNVFRSGVFPRRQFQLCCQPKFKRKKSLSAINALDSTLNPLPPSDAVRKQKK